MSRPMTRDALIARGRDRQAAGAPEEAEVFYREILADDPDDVEALHLLGVAAHQQGDHAGAVATIGSVVRTRPDFVAAWQNLVLPLVELGRLDEAIACGRRAVDLAPGKAGGRINLVRALILAERLPEAEKIATEAAAIDPRDPIPLCQLGHIRLSTGDAVSAERLFAKAAAIAPDNVEAHYNRGVAQQTLLLDEAAIGSYARAMTLDPRHRGARLNLGVALRAVGRIEEALRIWAGFDFDPETWPELAYDIACARLLGGDWAAAWSGYEHRFEAANPFARPPATTAPRWNGEALPERTVMVHHEQGLGDTVQFVRLLPDLVERVGRFVFVCQPALRALLASSQIFDGERISLVAEGEPIPAHDAWAPLLSLAGFLGLDRTGVRSTAVPCLVADPERVGRWTRRLAEDERIRSARLRVGLVWQGNPKAPVEKGRSIPLSAFAPLAAVPGVAFVSLQKGAGREQTPPPGLDLVDPGEGFDEGGDAFLDTVAILSTLDLVVTSDTSVAHVAGSLGRPVWLVVKKVPEWRWGLSGSVSPWYPTMRIFRQAAIGDWSEPMARVAADLGVLVGLRAAAGPNEGETANALFDAGITAHGAGRFDEAVALFRRVAAAAPRSAQVLNFLGLAMIETGGGRRALDEAVPIVAHSVALAPTDAGLFANWAVLLKRRGELDDARFALLHALRLEPDHRAVAVNLVNLETARGDVEAAMLRALEATRRHPGDAGVQSVASDALRAAGRFAHAVTLAERAVRLAPKDAKYRVTLGRNRAAAGDREGAARAWEEALALDPGEADALSNLGVHERNHGETGLALWFARTAVAVRPDHADAWSNLGIAAGERERPEEARDAFARAIALRPSHADARMALGMSLLGEGRFAEGLPEYEWRLKSTRLGLDTRPSRLTPWNGEDPRGKRFLIVAEQGFGDAIQFVRYAGVLKAMGAAAVHVGARGRLKRLLAGATGVDGVVGEGENLPAVDFHAHLMSLPHLTGTRLDSIPGICPYLFAEPDRVTRWAERLARGDGFRVGLVWQGNPDPQVDRGRSIPLAVLEPLAAIPGVRLISLQKGPGADQIAEVADRFAVESLGDDFDAGPDAFLDTAAVIADLDLVVATDTAVPHLAGALGRPVWLLLKAQPEWRWLADRVDTPWYPTMRLFRQNLGDPNDADRWRAPVARLAADLARLVDGDRSRLHDRTPPAPPPKPVTIPLGRRFDAALEAHRADRRAQARHDYAEILAEDTGHAEALHMTAALALQESRWARALFFCGAASRAGLDSPELASNTGVALRNLGRLGEAERVLRRVMAAEPTAETALTLANVLRDQDRADAAVEAAKTAVKLAPKSVKALRSLGNALRDHQDAELALRVFQRAVKIDPNDAEMRLDHAHALLQAGKYREGFAEYEWRWRSAELMPHRQTAPLWDGTRLPGKRVFVHGEQGLGDQIQFLRFVRSACERGVRVTVAVRPALVALARSLILPKGADVEVIAEGTEPRRHEAQVPLLGLPKALDLELSGLPGKVPYLAADPERVKLWRKRFEGDKRLTVGLVWQGNPGARADRGRSPPLAALEPLLRLDGVRFVALQKEHGLDQLAGHPLAGRVERPGPDFDAGPDAFLDTAAAMKALDLIVTSDTAAVHLAGALGRPGLVMLKHAADWRWLERRDDTPWYPSLTLVRQPRAGDWAAVAARVAEVVAEEAAARRGASR